MQWLWKAVKTCINTVWFFLVNKLKQKKTNKSRQYFPYLLDLRIYLYAVQFVVYLKDTKRNQISMVGTSKWLGLNETNKRKLSLRIFVQIKILIYLKSENFYWVCWQKSDWVFGKTYSNKSFAAEIFVMHNRVLVDLISKRKGINKNTGIIYLVKNQNRFTI